MTLQNVNNRGQAGDSVQLVGGSTKTLVGNVGDRLKVDATGTFSGEITPIPPTDFRARTYTVTTTPTDIVFPGFTILALAVKALSSNAGNLQIGKSSTIATDFAIMEPGDSTSLDLQASTSPVAFVKDASVTGNVQITVIAAGTTP